jgi:DNA-binding transcriptional ArsR family regulator
VDDIYRAIADPVRRAIVEELTERNDQTLFELCVRLLGRGFAITRQAVSKHAAILADAGLVQSSTNGRTTIHHLDPVPLEAVRAWLARMDRDGRGKEPS